MRLASLFGFGAALVCAAFLVACGGGGGRSSPISGGGSLSGGHSTNAQSAGTRVTVVINRTPHTAHARSTSRRGAQASRSPKYIPSNANGLQLTLSGTGGASQTVYADVSPSSPLCSTSNNIETCVITVPTLAASEQFVALETDTAPTNETSGYGTGFGTGSNIVGAISQSQTLQLGAANAIGLELGPVSGHFYDCSGYTTPTSLPQPYSPNFGIDRSVANDPTTGSRIVVTAGVAASGMMAPEFCNPGPEISGTDNNYDDYDSTPAPFVDVNGSPTPITLTSNTSALTLAPVLNNGTAPPASAYSQTASIANDGFEWYDCVFFVGIKTSASFTAPAMIVINNNLTAINPFTSSNYASTMTYTVATISVSSTTATVSQSGSTSITATDYGATNGTDGESSYTANTGPGNGGEDEYCKSSGGTILAYAESSAPINTTTWQQSIGIYGAGNGTGTCTFYVMDYEALTIAGPVTVTVTP